jgi:GNAT superfamily N-acetyltransferase
MAKERKRLTREQKAAKKKRQQDHMTVFVRGKQKRVPRPPTIDGMDPEEFVRRNADPIWLHQEGRWEDIVPDYGLVRPAEPADIPTIVALWTRFLLEEENAVENPDVEAHRDRWRWRLERQIEAGYAFVVERDNGIAGFACLIGRLEGRVEPRSEIPCGVAYVTDLYVVPEVRGTEAAADLVQRLVAAAYEAGFSEAWTNTGARNARAQAFFRRTGWRAMTGFALPGLENQVYFEHGGDAHSDVDAAFDRSDGELPF